MPIKKVIFICLCLSAGALQAHADDAGYLPESATNGSSAIIQKSEPDKTTQQNVAETAPPEAGKKENNSNSMQAATQTAQQSTLNEVVVTARKVPEILNLVPRSVDVITNEQIQDSGKTKAEDILQEISDITIEKYSGAEGTASLLMRGSASNQVLVLVDNMPTADMLSGATDMGLINLLNIDRIEVVKGGLSSIYGPDATAGVVNIITNSGLKNIINASVSNGSYNTLRETLGTAFKLGKAGISASGLQERSAGYLPNIDNFPGSDYLKRYFNGKLTFEEGWSKTTLTGNYLNRYAAYPGSISNPEFSGNQYDENYSFGADEIETLDAVKIDASVFKRSGDMTNTSPMYPSTRTVAKETQGSIMGIYDQLSYLSLIGGFDENIKTINDTSIGTKIIQNEGIMLNVSLMPIKALVADAGGRYDINTVYGNMYSWSFGAKYALPENTNVHGTMDYSFSAPTLDELYYSDIAWGIKSNPDLKPEQAMSYELGVDNKTDRFTGSLVWFYRSVTDLINYSYNPATYITTPVNIGKAVITGAEVKASYRPYDFWSIAAGYTCMLGTDEVSGKPLPYMPRNKITGNTSVSLPYAIKLSADAEYVDNRIDSTSGNSVILKPYYLLNINAAQKLNDNIRIFCNVSNIFDNTKYRIVYDYQTQGRMIMAGMEVQF